MAAREEYAPWDGKWIGYDWFKLLTALILLLLLIGAWLAFGGPPPRLPPLLAPVVGAPAAGATLTAGAVTFSGQATPGSTVRVVIDGAPLGTVTADGSGMWSLMTTLDRAGQYQIVAEALRPDGTVVARSVPQNLIVSALAIAAPTLNLPDRAAPGNVAFRGEGAPGSIVEVLVDGQPVGQTTVGADGRWSLVGNVAAGERQVVARVIDASGAPGAAAPASMLMVIAPPVITSLRDGAQVTAGKLTLSGVGQPGSQVELRDGDRVLGTVTVAADGQWRFEYDAPPGALQLSARLVGDPASASAPLRVTVNPAAAAPPPPQTGGTGAQTGGADIPAALPRTSGDSVPWSALVALTVALLGGGIWMRLRR